MRLDKFISNNSLYSRSDIKRLIKSQRIAVNDESAASPEQKIKPKHDVVKIDGTVIEAVGKLYLMLHKPAGVVCANSDSEHPTVIDLLRDETCFVGKKNAPLPLKDLQIAGRLDMDTTGLVLITNDGKWNQRVTSPATDCKKVYLVTLREPIDPKVTEIFARGVQLEGEKKKTRPAILHIITPTKVTLALSEGKYHQVKRMFAATGNGVKTLHREAVAGIVLDKQLKPGQCRFLTEQELHCIQAHTAKTPSL